MKMQPCGFCFVEYATRVEAALAVDTLNRSVLDGMTIRVDWDYGFEPQRQFGRGKQGGQVRDEIRVNQGRGGPRDDDRPLVTYSHAKRDYSQRRNYGDSRNYGEGGRSSQTRKRTYRDRNEGEDDGYQGRSRDRLDRGERYSYRGQEKRLPGMDDYQDIDNAEENALADFQSSGGAMKRRRVGNNSYGAFGSYNSGYDNQYEHRKTQSSSQQHGE